MAWAIVDLWGKSEELANARVAEAVSPIVTYYDRPSSGSRHVHCAAHAPTSSQRKPAPSPELLARSRERSRTCHEPAVWALMAGGTFGHSPVFEEEYLARPVNTGVSRRWPLSVPESQLWAGISDHAAPHIAGECFVERLDDLGRACIFV